jgi:hypothetical protein
VSIYVTVDISVNPTSTQVIKEKGEWVAHHLFVIIAHAPPLGESLGADVGPAQDNFKPVCSGLSKKTRTCSG